MSPYITFRESSKMVVTRSSAESQKLPTRLLGVLSGTLAK